MTNQRFHGIASLVLIMLASVLGLVVIVLHSWLWGGIYLVVMAGLPQILLRTFCAKCACKAHCGHILPGKAALAFEKAPGPYTPVELLTVVGAVGLLLGLPQFWLWRMPLFAGIYWLLVCIALLQIRFAMCPPCENTYCPLRIRARVKEREIG